MKPTNGYFLLMAIITIMGCNSENNQNDINNTNSIPQAFKVSECGGFDQKSDALTAYAADPADYCDAEMLHWQYDAQKKTLKLLNTRVLLNCCGDHSIKATLENGTYVIQETDAPEGGNGRCLCTCVYDYSIDLQEVSGTAFSFKLLRNVTDSKKPEETVLEDKLDLTQGSGSIVVNTSDASPWCEPKSSTSGLTQAFKVSECGGFQTKESKSSQGTPAPGYCDAEKLTWNYDEKTQTLKVDNTRVLLNCCGDHSIKAALENGTYVIKEVDEPKDGGARCKCACVFDFSIEMHPLKSSVIDLKLVREVSDSNDPAKTVFTGKLDLSKGNGEEIVDKTDVGMWCQSSSEPEPVAVPQAFQISECGGFKANRSESKAPQTYSGDTLGYCDAEVLHWQYDAQSKTLKLADNRLLLNCCGEHSIKVTQENGAYLVKEIDAPQQGGLRCNCMCVFDYSVDVQELEEGLFTFKLEREITDEKKVTQLYDGQIDLKQKSGSIVLDKTDVGIWCQEK